MHIHQPSPIEARDEGLNGHAPVKVCSGLTSTVCVCVCVCVRDRPQVQFSLSVTWLKLLPSFRVVRSALMKQKTCWCVNIMGEHIDSKWTKLYRFQRSYWPQNWLRRCAEWPPAAAKSAVKTSHPWWHGNLREKIINVAELMEPNETKNCSYKTVGCTSVLKSQTSFPTPDWTWTTAYWAW